MGNGGQWMNKPGFTTTHTPTEHSALSFSPGQAGADPIYGHISFVEQVKSDGSILVSECNVKGLGIISYRTFDAETAKTIYLCYWTLERIIIWDALQPSKN